ncbi:hypothetical protein HZS_4488 [Henneguya salminicola]|nr:hypothetical protein HZS_4488 [Henneguya salminicola]
MAKCVCKTLTLAQRVDMLDRLAKKEMGESEDVKEALKKMFFSSSSSSTPNKRPSFDLKDGVTCKKSVLNGF